MARTMGRIAEATLRLEDPGMASASHESKRLATRADMPRLLELMELAAIRLMRSRLGAEDISSGVAIRLRHVTPAPFRGFELRAVATHRAMTGWRHRIEVHVFDGSGLVASGEHLRTIASGRRTRQVTA